jgi:hypothetical protein
MSIILNDNFSTEFNKPLDNRFGPYVDISTALSQLPSYRRFIGLTVGIGTNPVIEYWFNDGILDTDFVQKIANVNSPVTSVNGKTGDVIINKNDVSLGNVDNTSDINKPISTLVQNALNLKEGTITAGTTAQYWRGDKTFQTLDKTAVGLSNVDNTSDANKPISTATQMALNGKQATISLTTTGNSGASTFAANVLNIPNYTLAGLGGIGLTALSSIATGLTYNNTTGVFSLTTGYAIPTTASASNWDSAYTNRITSLTTTGSSGAATLTANVLNIPNYSLSGLGGQPLNANLTSISALTYASTSFVKMTAAGTFALDTNTYLTAESDTLASVTGRGNTTTNAITVGNLTVNGTIRNTIGSANLYTSNVIGGTTISLHSDTPISSNYFIRADTQSVILNAPQSNGFLLFRQGNGSVGQFFGTTGNFTLQNGGTFTDAGFRLDVNGTARIQNQLTTTGSITASSAIARGVYMNQTLVAAANNDVLVGLDINPTFTNGAFTGVTQIGVRIAGTILPSVHTGFNIGTNNAAYGRIFSVRFSGTSVADLVLSSTGTTTNINFQLNDASGNIVGRFFNTTGNLVLQNGGTFTDAGYRLDVQGTARVSNVLTLGSLASDPTGTNGMIYYNTTTNRFKVYQNGAWATVTAI